MDTRPPAAAAPVFSSGHKPHSGEVKVKITLEHAMNAQRGVEVQLYSFFNLGAK
jgi:hypothetical protein